MFKIFTIFVFSFFVLITNLKAEILLENKFPSKFYGVWSNNCESPESAWKISEYVNLWIDENAIYLDFSKTTEINGYTIASWKDNDEVYYFFLKLQNNKLIVKYSPEDWNKIDFEFLLDSTSEDTESYNKCKGMPEKYITSINLLNIFLDSNVPNICFEKGLKSNQCVSSFFSYGDIYRDGELTIAELTRLSKTFFIYLVLNGYNYDDAYKSTIKEKNLILTGASFAFAPTFSQLLIMNYDYDDSKSLSLNELFGKNSDFINNISIFLDNEIKSIQEIFDNIDKIL
jgi:hypothetical protein|tara:strand:+ start:172 stop:1029 length:858 start_codon:yes stop_codon:yes gene_type:complete